MSRRDQILSTAAELFARDGFNNVSIADLGAACEISGPAIYKHFRGKQAILAELLIGLSERLLADASQGIAKATSPQHAIAALADLHVANTIAHPTWIIVQDRDWTALQVEAREKVAKLQHDYVDLWVTQLVQLRPELAPRTARAMVHGTFGLLNSTPHNAVLPPAEVATLLTDMALRGLGVAGR